MARKTIFVCDLTGRTSTRKTLRPSRSSTPMRARVGRARRERRRGRRSGVEGDEAGAPRPKAEGRDRLDVFLRAGAETAPASFFPHFPRFPQRAIRGAVGSRDYYGPMALTLLAGPANAGKVALLLDRYLADLPREPTLIVPNRSDVERVERDLLGRAGALLGGSIGTFDDVFERIAGGSGARRPVIGEAQRSLLLRRAVAASPLEELGRSARFAGFADALGTTVAELEAGLLDPDDLDGDLAELYRRYREELDRLGLWDRDLQRRCAAERVAGRARRVGRPPGLRVRLRRSDRGPVATAGGVRRPCRRHRLAAVRAGPGRLRLARAHGRRSRASGRRPARGAAAPVRRVRAPRARAPRAGALPGRTAAGTPDRGGDPLPGGCRHPRHARARRRRDPAAAPRRHGARGDPGRLPLARAHPGAARGGIRRARSPVRARRAAAPLPDAVRAGAALAASLRLARGWPPRPLRLHALALLGAAAGARRLPRGAAARARDPVAGAGRDRDRQAARPAARVPRPATRGPVLDRRRARAGADDAGRGTRPRLAAGDRRGSTRPARVPGDAGAARRARGLARARRPGVARGARERARAGARAHGAGPGRGGRRPRPAARAHPARGGRVRARAGGGRAAAADPAVAVPRRGAPAAAGRPRAAREGRPGLPGAVPLLHRVHAAVAAPLPRPGGGDRRRRAAPGEPVLGRRSRRARPRGRPPLDAAAAALGAGLADRGGAERARAPAGARLAVDHRPSRRRRARARERMGAPPRPCPGGVRPRPAPHRSCRARAAPRQRRRSA